MENLTTYTESGADAGVIAQTPARNTWTNAERDSDALLSKSFGAGFFKDNATINHLYETTDTVHVDNDAIVITWQLSNVLKSIVDMIAASDDFVAVRNYAFATKWGHYLIEGENGVQYATSNTVTQSFGTITYPRVYYDSAVGSFGTLYLYVYSDEARASLIDSVSLALHAVPTFEYFVPFNTRGDVARATTGWSQNYDLQLAVSGVAKKIASIFGIGKLGIRC